MEAVKEQDEKLTAGVSEVFSSLQGEGPLVGVRQIFVRFYPCNLRCAFCDLPASRGFKKLTIEELITAINSLERTEGPHHSVSLTGGEPLLYAEYLKFLLPRLKENFKIYLETNGTLPGGLEQIIDLVDWVAMDMKLPSSTGEKPYWKEHEQFLKIARQREVFVKTVITVDTTGEDLLEAARIAGSISADAPFVLQPVTPAQNSKNKVPSGKRLFDLMNSISGLLEDVRVIPQVHKLLGLR